MKNQLEGVSFDGSRLSITPVKAIVSSEGEGLANQLDAMMPRIRITELLNEVAEHSGFLGAFTNLRTGGTCPNESALLAAILADATNLGLSRMMSCGSGRLGAHRVLGRLPVGSGRASKGSKIPHPAERDTGRIGCSPAVRPCRCLAYFQRYALNLGRRTKGWNEMEWYGYKSTRKPAKPRPSNMDDAG
ncbi:hypothetical protein RU07_17830 [Agrobacterium tumefaciens]|uniref:Tn3 transposase DDE domain-containing protein n=1 Tax=Agrobacterium tumefaciens TaxID=358 RepID=A0A0D0KPJ8_AGRTU|nr:hypothetical protein RU07_17830 [Agrobacterium tumefaciens]